MSLILEALKKLEREKQAPEPRGFLVVGAAPWPVRRSRLAAAAVALVGVAGIVAAGLFLSRRAPAPSPSPAPPVASVAPAAPVPATPGPAAPPAAVTSVDVPPVPEALQLPGPRADQPAPAPSAAEPAPPPAAGPAESLVLQAISWRDGRPIAVVNHRVVREGDAFDGVRVVRIGAAEVELEVEGRRTVLRF